MAHIQYNIQGSKFEINFEPIELGFSATNFPMAYNNKQILPLPDGGNTARKSVFTASSFERSAGVAATDAVISGATY